MNFSIRQTFLVFALCMCRDAWGHGFGLSVNDYSNPTQFTVASQSPFLDPQDQTAGPSNLFIEEFSGTTTAGANGAYYYVEHGFAQTSGPFPQYSGATFNVVSPLLFSDGSPTVLSDGSQGPAVAQLASSGTSLYMYDRDYSTITGPIYPGATGGTLSINGDASFYNGFGVSLYDAHEIAKELFLGAGSTQTYGEYGFGFTVTVPFTINGVLTDVTSPVMVDVFAITAPTLGDFADNASLQQQDAATLAIYNAIVPEPSTWSLAAIAVAGLALMRLLKNRRKLAMALPLRIDAWLRARLHARRRRPPMHTIARGLGTLSLALIAHNAWGHGFDIAANVDPTSGYPVSFSITSAQPVLDNTGSPAAGPSNLFLDAFDATPNSDGSYGTYEGFAQTAGSFPPYANATFNIVSPLYFSDGTGGAAVPAVSGTYLNIYDLWAGNPDPITNPHPGASAGNVEVNGTTPFYTGFGVSLYDFHELQKDLYLAAGSTQTYGEYGFAFTVTVPFSDGVMLTTGPLVDVFAISDPTLGDFGDNAPQLQQDAATSAIYAAVVPEPGTWSLAVLPALLMLASLWRRRLATAVLRATPGNAIA